MAEKVSEVTLTLRIRHEESVEAGWGGEAGFVDHVLNELDMDGMDVHIGGNDWATIEVVRQD